MSTSAQRLPLYGYPGFRFAVACAAVVVALFVAAAARLAAGPTEALVGAVVVVTSVAMTGVVGLAIGAVGWAFYTGFVEHRYGLLTFGGEDLARLALLVGLGLLVALSTRRTTDTSPRTGRTSD